MPVSIIAQWCVTRSRSAVVILASIARQAYGNAMLPRGAEDGDPFPELQIGRDDDAGLLIEFADQVEQQTL